MKRKAAARSRSRSSHVTHTSIIGILIAISGTVALAMMIVYLFDVFEKAPIM